MNPEVSLKIYDTEVGTFWFDDDGILNHVAKPVTFPALDKLKQNNEFIKQICDNQTVCFLSNANKAQPMNQQMRDFVAEELPQMFKAMAIISNSMLSTMIANIFFKLKGQPVPMKMFTNENEAKKWLRQYL